jgi:hypothetical protein
MLRRSFSLAWVQRFLGAQILRGGWSWLGVRRPLDALPAAFLLYDRTDADSPGEWSYLREPLRYT